MIVRFGVLGCSVQYGLTQGGRLSQLTGLRKAKSLI